MEYVKDNLMNAEEIVHMAKIYYNFFVRKQYEN